MNKELTYWIGDCLACNFDVVFRSINNYESLPHTDRPAEECTEIAGCGCDGVGLGVLKIVPDEVMTIWQERCE